MALNTNSVVSSMYKNNTAEVEKNKETQQTKKANTYGKTVGEPELSEKATKYYDQLKSSMEKPGANVKGYGMQVNDNGTTSFFAVLKKSSSDQKARIEKTAEKKKAAKKEADRKAAKKEQEERIKKTGDKISEKVKDIDDEETVTITASSIEELMNKMNDYAMEERSNNVRTDSEKMVGQHVDFRG